MKFEVFRVAKIRVVVSRIYDAVQSARLVMIFGEIYGVYQ